jgi:hypothetical protein
VVTHRRRFKAFGASFCLGAEGRALLGAAVKRARTLGWIQAAGASAAVEYVFRQTPQDETAPCRFELDCDGAPIRRAADLRELLDAFEDHAKLLTACHAKGVLFVHAGVIGWRGRGILIPGRSGAGKTTLVRALIEAGADYYSDEFAVLDADGQVQSYALPLSIRGSGVRPVRCSAEQIGARVGAAPVSVDLIVITEYQRHARWRPRVLSKAEALLALMENTVAARQPPQHTLPLLRQTVLRARAIRSKRGEARAIVDKLLAGLP